MRTDCICYETVVRPEMMYWVETWTVKKAQDKKLDVAEMRMLRWIQCRLEGDRAVGQGDAKPKRVKTTGQKHRPHMEVGKDAVEEEDCPCINARITPLSPEPSPTFVGVKVAHLQAGDDVEQLPELLLCDGGRCHHLETTLPVVDRSPHPLSHHVRHGGRRVLLHRLLWSRLERVHS